MCFRKLQKATFRAHKTTELGTPATAFAEQNRFFYRIVLKSRYNDSIIINDLIDLKLFYSFENESVIPYTGCARLCFKPARFRGATPAGMQSKEARKP